MNVSNQLAEITIRLAENRLVSALKNVPDLFVLAIVILAVARQHSLHDSADRIVLHFDQEVHVVGLQAVGVQIERQLLFLLRDDAGEPDVIVVRTEDLSSIIAAADDVIETSADLDPWFAGHDGGAYTCCPQMSTNSGLTPPDAVMTHPDGVMLFLLTVLCCYLSGEPPGHSAAEQCKECEKKTVKAYAITGQEDCEAKPARLERSKQLKRSDQMSTKSSQTPQTMFTANKRRETFGSERG